MLGVGIAWTGSTRMIEILGTMREVECPIEGCQHRAEVSEAFLVAPLHCPSDEAHDHLTVPKEWLDWYVEAFHHDAKQAG